MRRATMALLAVGLAAIPAYSQSDAAAPKKGSGGGVITGRVLDDGGQPIFNADVRLYELGGDWGARVVTVATDEDGEFRADGLGPHAYSIDVTAAGYVRDLSGPRESSYHYTGDTVTVRVTKGGVVTGKVTRADGEPVIGVTVTGTMVREADGRHASDVDFSETTDDRGVYRIYGMTTGTYVVSAGGPAQYWGGRTPSFTADDAPTYYPSATIDGASEISVRTGQEVTGIDIVYRGERGHKASGVVVGADAKRAWLRLRRVSPSADIASANSARSTGTFEFAALADGDYEVSAMLYGDESAESIAPPVAFKVRGADVSGLKLVLAPISSVAGNVVLTGMPAADAEATCPAKSARTLTEVVVNISRDMPVRGGSLGTRGSASADATGAFKMTPVEAARYRVSPRLPDDGWYVQSVLRTAPGQKAPADVARDGVSVGAGQEITGVTVTIAAGAARAAGRVMPADEGGALLGDFRVHLVPAEPAAGDAVLRFYEVKTERDGTFEIKNIAPGAYRAIAVPEPAERDGDPPYRPAAWDAAKRATLRKAVAALPEIRLDPCARESSLVLHPTEVKALFAAPRAR